MKDSLSFITHSKKLDAIAKLQILTNDENNHQTYFTYLLTKLN